MIIRLVGSATLLGAGIVVSAVSTLSRGRFPSKVSTTTKVSKPVKKWPNDYEHQCYKWIIVPMAGKDLGGELIVCPTEKGVSTPLFYLWWLGAEPSKPEYNSFTRVDSINSIKGNSIGFKFKTPPKILISTDTKLNWWNAQSLTKLIGKPLENNCKMELDVLSCSSLGYTSKKMSKTHAFYF